MSGLFKRKIKESASREFHTLKFWGVRGSIPVPQIEMLGIGGDTSCIELRTASGHLLIFDMGTGIRLLGTDLIQSQNGIIQGHILLSHTHWDHIQGLPFFQPVFIKGNHFKIYGPAKSGEHLGKTLAGQMENKYFPVSLNELNSDIEIEELEEGRHKIEEGIIVEVQIHNHPNGALGYRVELEKRIISYVTDCEHPVRGIDNRIVELARNSDVLIHDAHFTTEELPNHVGWGHSSWEKSVDVAIAANVEKLVLFHFSPNYTDDTVYDIERKARARFPNTFVARQGLEIKIPV